MRYTRAVAGLALGLSAAVGASGQSAPARVSIPKGAHVLVDGRIGAGEWADARKVALSSAVALYLKRDARYVYVAIEPTGSMFGADLYFDWEGAPKILNLHASAKLGEREGRFGAWPEWSWWNNRGWAANVVRPQSFEQPDFLPDAAKEFQIDATRIGARRIWVSLDMLSNTATEALPAAGVERHGRKWLEIEL